MLQDARKFDDGFTRECDICIIGAGVAGLSLAHRLESSGLKVILLESGGSSDTGEFDHLNSGTSLLADYPFQSTRARAFGGTTHRWTGACIELDKSDFETRGWLAGSGWPIQYDDLARYYKDASEIFGMSQSAGLDAALQSTNLHGDGLTAKVVQYSNPLNLGTKYNDAVANSQNIDCWLYSTVTQLVVDSSGNRVQAVTIRTPNEHTISIRPRAVVMAGGGLENPRLLLLSNNVLAGGIGNQRDLVGRYHMEHPIKSLAILPIGEHQKEMRLFTDRTQLDHCTAQGTFGLSRKQRDTDELLDLHFRIYRYNALEDDEAVIGAKNALSRAPARNEPKLGVLGALQSSMTLGRYLTWHLANKAYRKAPFDHIRLTAFLEQEPEASNRVSLGADRDSYGMALPHLEYRESSFMRESHENSLARISELLAARGLPGLRFKQEEITHLDHYAKYGLHQMGSTRMANSPAQGVVDRDCRVFGQNNLFVAGSSVFSTGGAANPTLTIAALALRLADHLSNLDLRTSETPC